MAILHARYLPPTPSPRHRLLDYLFTAFHKAHLDGTPVLHPLWHIFPKDQATYCIDLQIFFGDSIPVSPVTKGDATSVTAYLPKETYDFQTYNKIEGQSQNVTFDNIDFTRILSTSAEINEPIPRF